MRFPTWKEVESDPEFQSLEPTKKKEYFGKWSKTAVDRAMQQGLYRDNDFASGFTGWYNQKAKEYGEEEEAADFQQLSTRLRQPPKVGTSILEEITQIPSAFKSAIDQPLEAFGETAEVLGAPALAQTLKGAVEAPKDYKTAAESFMRPEEGEFEVAGFAPQYLPRAIVEQAGQLAGAIGTRIAGAAVGGVVGAGVGSVVPGLGTAAGVAGGTAVGAFTGPAVFEMAQIVGPVARERAKNNGRVDPNNEDLAWAWTTAGTSGALNAIGAKYIPGGEKLVGGISKKIAASILGEGLTESGQALAQQTGETILTEKGLTVSPKEAIAEGIIGGAAGGLATAIFERADKKPEDPTKAAATKAAADQLAEANKTALELSANNAPITAKVVQDQAAKDFSAIAETEEAVEEVERFAPPEDAITKQELKTQYFALSPEDLTDTEVTFRERLDDEDPEMRTFAQNALDAITEVRAEQAKARPLPTDVLPTETPGATYGREADIYDVFAGVRRRPMPPSGPAFESAQVIEEATRRADVLRRTPEGRELLRRELQGEEMVGGVRRATEEALATAPEPAEGDVFAEIRRPSRAEEAAITIEQQLAEDERIRRSQLGAEALREELAQVESKKQQTIVEQEQAKFLPQKETAKILNELTTAEQAAITGSLLSQGLVTRSEALSILRRASDEGVTSGQIAAIEPEATKKWNERTRDGVLAGRVIGEKQTKTGNIILRAEQERTKKPVITKPNSLAPKDVIGKTVREALKFASTQNLIQTKDLIEGRASWASGIVPKPNYAMMQDIAAIMSEQNIPALDKEKVIPLSSRGRRGRASRFWGGDIGFPSTMNEDVGTLVHEVGHSLTADLIRKYAPRGSVKSGKDYVGLLGKTINDKSAPDGIRRLFRLYISTLDQLGISDVYTKAGGLAGKRHPDESRSAARKLQSSGKLRDDLKWGDLYALANVEEFVSQTFSSNEFRNLLKTLKDPDTKKSLWREFVQAIKEVFGLPADSMAAAVIETTFDIGVPRTLEESLIVLKNDIVGRVLNYNIPNEDAEFLADEVITRTIESKEIDNDASVNSILEFIETNIIPPLIDGYFAKPAPPATPPPAAEAPTLTPAAPAEAAPVGIAVGNRVKTKTTPQSFVVEEVLPQSEREVELGEQYYSIRNERTGETQVVESNDISPIKGKRTRKISPVRAEEKYAPIPEADRYTFREASGRAIRFFGGERPENFVIVNNSTDPDYEFKAGYDPETGEIILNRAYIQRGENIEDILTHELGHYIYSDPQFQADFQDFLDSMPDEARAEIDRIVNEGYNKETNEVQIEEREVMAFTSLIRRTKRGLTAWEKLKDTIKKIINRFLGTNITLSDQGAMAVFNVGYKRFNSGERIIREMKEGTLRTAPEGMNQMDRDYLAAVERGDMETAQRMVDETAKAAGYNIGPVWHGTNSKFNIFDRKKSREGRFGKGFYFSPSESTANAYAEDAVRTLGGEKFVGKYFLKDAFNYKDSIFVATNPQEIKSADPVTYDDAGNVIPLSQRFRPTSPDIRRMAPEPAPAPEAVVEEAPAERPKRRTKMQNIIDISTDVKRPKTKLTVNEMTALKDQIKLGARKRKEDKRTQREFAKDLTQQLREAAIRGKVRPSQLRAITSKALQTQFDNDASILGFVNYANKVIENANYEKDLSDAKAAIKSAKRLAKQKGLAANIKANLEKLANIDPRQIEPEEMVGVEGEAPISVAEFTAVLKEYMKAGGPVTAEEYVLVPDAEITDFLTKLGEQIETNRKATENLGMDGELSAIADKTPEEIDAELARDEERRNRIEQKINGLAEGAQVALVNYDNPEITSEEKIVLDDMKRITLSDISIGERKEFIKIANNILVNNKFLGAQKFASMARGQIGAVEAAKDSKTVNRNSATLKVYENLLGENFGRLVNLGTQSFADTFRNLTGTQGLPRLLYQMGFGEIERGQANTNRARREITDGVQQRFKQIEKETGQRIAETQGVYSMGVAGNLIQIHPDETEAEGIQRMRGLIEKDIEKKKKSPKTEDRKTALYVEKALDEVYADSIQGILDNLNRLHPSNYKALTFLMNEVLPEYKSLLKEHDELFNNQTENYENPYYLPIRYRSIGTEPKKPGELRGRASDSVTAPKQAPNSIKRIKNSVLPEGKQFDYNLTRNVLDSLSTQLEAAYTNPGWQQVYAFLKSPEAVEALGGVENYDFVTKRINNLSDSRERRIYQMDPFNQAADFVANMVRKIGTSIALGGIGQAAKQMPDQVATTIANVNDLSITTPAFTEIKEALPAMRQFSIGERGEIAGGSKWVNQLEGNFTKLQQFMQDGLWPKAMEAFENLNNFWLIPLKVSDTVAASHGWISYYKKYLKDNDIQFTNWDNESDLIAKGDRSRVEAGLYADQMIDIYQGSSDPTKMATFAQRGDSGGGNLLKTMIMPFSSFVIQQRSRILSDLRDISYGDTDEKKVAAKGLAGTLLGIVIFHGVRRYALPFLTGGVAAAAYGLLGVDMEEPDEEERLEKERRVFRQFLGEVASNIFVGGYSAYAETRLIDAVNAAAYFYEIQTQSENVLDDKGEIMSWEKYRKERAPMYRYTGPGADSTLGMLDILPSQARETFDRLKDLSDDEIMDSLTEEEQRVLILAALSETLYTMRLNDADVARMVKRMAKDVKDQAEARQKAERQLQRIYGQ